MIEPGARLAGRYRLDEPINKTDGATFWKATDETLARLVAVWTFEQGFPRTSEVVRAARATSRVADSRVTQVFDADDTAPTPYVVEEWVAGQSLTDLLAQGPLEPERAAGLVAEAAETLATANATGLFHLHLTPGKLMWSVGGAVKVTGIGVDAALHGIGADQPAVADARGLGRLLFAALTAHWPEGSQAGLPPAPTVSGGPCQPSQIRAGIPERLNEIACRAAFQAPVRGGPLTNAREVADALADVPRVVPLPVTPAHASRAPQPEQGTSRRSGEFAAAAAPPAPPRREPRPSHRAGGGPSSSSGTAKRALVGVGALLVFVAVVVAAWNIGSTMAGGDPSDGGDQTGNGGGDDQQKLDVIQPAAADGFDPRGDGSEHGDKANNAIDGDPSTAWNTQSYNSARFGNLKEGVGLALKLDQPTEIHEVSVDVGGGAADFDVLVGDEKDLSALDKKAEQAGAKGQVDVKLSDPAKGQYVVVWFTKLPQDGKYRGTVNEVELRGKT